MKERLVKGRHVCGVIELLSTEGRLETLPELSPPAADLIRKPVYPTTWYQLRAYDDLLQSVHRYVFDGSEAAGQRMGRILADRNQADPRSQLVPSDTPLGAGQVLHDYWKRHFNFGHVEAEALPAGEAASGVRLRVTGFPDMSACQGHVLMGWAAEMLERGCGGTALLRVEERPWMHHGVLTFTLIRD